MFNILIINYSVVSENSENSPDHWSGEFLNKLLLLSHIDYSLREGEGTGNISGEIWKFGVRTFMTGR